MKKLLNRRIAIVAVAVIATVAFFSFKSGDDRNFQIAKNLDIFNAIVKELDMFYVDTIDPNKTIREGIDNMLYTLDPYTEYYPEEDQSELEQMIKGSFGGIGSYIAYNTKLKRSMISEPFEGTPAAKAGLKAGDILMEIDGKDLAGKNNAEVSQMLRGQAGTSFKLKIERPNVKGGRTPMEFTIVRESIQNPAIPYTAVLDNNIGYIGLSTFSGNPSKEFKKAFLDLKKQGATSLVIDLRSNGGGLLDEAVEIANYFLPRGKVIVTTKGKIKQASNTYKTLREPLDLDIPIAVLVNSGTASASEILSGSLQDLDRAVIVGNRTFGKGLVQVPRSLPYGGTMKVTTSKYYIPSGRCVQAIDYKHRNEDGSVGTIPDSLTKVFYTAAGREVRDGGGVMPDITIKQEKLPNILFYLVRDNLIFDYATQYCLKHPTIVAPEKFEVTDADYNDFKALVKKADFKYDQQSEKILKTLKEAAEFEGYMDDASEEVYEFILCCICPVKLSEAGLCYNTQTNRVEERMRDQWIEAPVNAFLFPAFDDRSSNIHSLLYYTKKTEELHEDFINDCIGGPAPMSFKTQKAVFQEIIEETVGDVVNYDTVCQIQENLTELIEEHKEEPQPFKLQKSDVKKLLQNSGIKEEKLENFEQVYEETAGEDAFFQAANLVEAKSVAVKTPDVTIKVSPQRMDLVQIQLVEGRRCIVIPMEDGVQINGMNVTMEGTNGTD